MNLCTPTNNCHLLTCLPQFSNGNLSMSLSSNSSMNFEGDNEKGTRDALKMFLTPTHILCLRLKHIF